MTTRSRYTAAITDKPWWLAGGIPANACVAAYQAIGASSQVASYTNLANPGSYTLTTSAAPTWDCTTGWTGNGSSMCLNTNLVPKLSHSIFIRVVAINGTGTYFGQYVSGYKAKLLWVNATTQQVFNSGYQYVHEFGYAVPTGVHGMSCSISGFIPFWNGVAVSTTKTVEGVIDTATYYILARNRGATRDLFSPATIAAVAVYDTELTSTRVAALTDAMNAL